MKKAISLLIVFSLLALTISCTQYHAQGAGAGGAIGAIAGALLDRKNPWRGGAKGALLGGVLGATLTDISMRASSEAVAYGRPVEYWTANGRDVYRAEPVGYNAVTKCHKVHERQWENGQLVNDRIREVCRGNKFERGY